MIGLWLLILVQIGAHYFPQYNFFAMVLLDLISVGLILVKLREIKLRPELQKQIKEGRFNEIRKRYLHTFSNILHFLASLFLAIWLSRWAHNPIDALFLPPQSHYFNFLDVACFMLAVSWITNFVPFRKFFSRLDLSSSRQVFIWYFLTATVGALLLILPFSIRENQSLSLIDAFFISVSALSVTGLSPVDVSAVFTLLGQSILLGLIQLGGLGVVMIAAGLSLAGAQRVSLGSARLCKELYDIPDLGRVPDFLAKVVSLTLAIEFLGTIAIYTNLPQDTPNRLFHALFHAVSAFCNAGFSTFSANLEGSPIKLPGIGFVCVLVVVGGLSFPVLFELGGYLKGSKENRFLSANTKLIGLVTLGLLFFSTLAIFLFETLGNSNLSGWQQKIGQALFYAVHSRTAGFNSVPVAELQLSTIFVLLACMFVGAGPLSTGGGIKTSTLGILGATALSYLRGHQKVEAFKRSVPVETVMRAVSGVGFYLLALAIAVSTLLLIEEKNPIALLFECVSALSTVGLSMGITAELSPFSKLIIIFLMLFGRVGILAVLFAGFGQRGTRRYGYPEDHFFVG